MGVIFSRFRTKKSTIKILEELDKNIQSIEEYGYSTEQRRRRVVGTLVAFSIGLYVVAVMIFYLYFRLTSWKDLLLYASPLLVFPFVIYFLRFALSRYYEWKIQKNKTKLIDMRAEKKKILEEVMDKETYKNAKQILDKFGEPKDTLVSSNISSSSSSHLVPLNNTLATPVQLRHRQAGPVARLGSNSTPSSMRLGGSPNLTMSLSRELTPMMNRNLTRPLLPAQRGPFERLVDYLIGDGPENRFALICSSCKAHNGMAMPEEFEFISYRCAYCQTINPARKQKPKPPPLVTSSPRTPALRMKEHLSSSSDSDNNAEDTKAEKVDSDTDASVTNDEVKEEAKVVENKEEPANNGELIKNEEPVETD